MLRQNLLSRYCQDHFRCWSATALGRLVWLSWVLWRERWGGCVWIECRNFMTCWKTDLLQKWCRTISVLPFATLCSRWLSWWELWIPIGWRFVFYTFTLQDMDWVIFRSLTLLHIFKVKLGERRGLVPVSYLQQQEGEEVSFVERKTHAMPMKVFRHARVFSIYPCMSVRPSVGPLVRWSVGWSVRHTFGFPICQRLWSGKCIFWKCIFRKLFWPKAHLAQTFSNWAYPELLRACLAIAIALLFTLVSRLIVVSN